MARVRPVEFARQADVQAFADSVEDQLAALEDRGRIIEAALSSVLDSVAQIEEALGFIEDETETEAETELQGGDEDVDEDARLDAEAEAEAERLRAEAEEAAEAGPNTERISPYARRNEAQGLITEPPDGPRVHIGESAPGEDAVLGDFKLPSAPGEVPGRQIQAPRGPEGEEGWSGSSPA